MLRGNTSTRARADRVIQDYNSFQRTSNFDICIVSPTCDSDIGLDIPKLIAKTEKRKNDKYATRVKEHLDGDFYPFIVTSGGVIGALSKKIMKQIATRLSTNSFHDEIDIAIDIKNDIGMSLLKSRIQGLRSNRNHISSQISKFRLIDSH